MRRRRLLGPVRAGARVRVCARRWQSWTIGFQASASARLCSAAVGTVARGASGGRRPWKPARAAGSKQIRTREAPMAEKARHCPRRGVRRRRPGLSEDRGDQVRRRDRAVRGRSPRGCRRRGHRCADRRLGARGAHPLRLPDRTRLPREVRHSWRQTPLASAFIDSASPTSMASVVRFLAGPEFLRLFLEDPAGYIRPGGSDGLASLAPEDPVWVTFAESMTPFTLAAAKATATHARRLARRRRGACSTWPRAAGCSGSAVAQACPEASVVAVDSPDVVAVAARNAEQAGLAGATGRWRATPSPWIGASATTWSC